MNCNLDAAALIPSLLKVASEPRRVAALHGLLGEFCHEWRNYLNAFKLSLYLARRGEPSKAPEIWSEIDRIYRGLERFVDELQFVCRPMAVCPIRLELGEFFADRLANWAGDIEAVGRVVELEPPPDLVHIQVDPVLTARAFDALLGWRLALGVEGPIRVRWGANRGQARIVWEETGASRQGADPGGSCPALAGCPVSLALPMLARVAAVQGGEVLSYTTDGSQLALGWPLAPEGLDDRMELLAPGHGALDPAGVGLLRCAGSNRGV